MARIATTILEVVKPLLRKKHMAEPMGIDLAPLSGGLLAESGDFLLAESGNFLIQE